MNILAIDPSITATGLALFADGGLVQCGLIKPKKSFTVNKVKTTIPAHKRIDELIDSLDLFMDGVSGETRFVIEITSGKTAGRLGKNVQGLGTYGMAVGQVVRWAIDFAGSRNMVKQVYENDWTRGSSKSRRQEHAKYAYPFYRQNWYDGDKGGDISDAIMLGDWWMNTGKLIEQAVLHD